MRKLKMFEHISLDGVIQVRGSGEDGDYPSIQTWYIRPQVKLECML